jgi:ComF family protein
VVLGGVGTAIQALVDFLVDERCHACGRRVDVSARLPRPVAPASSALASPLRVAHLRTRPLCRACCHQLVPATVPALIARPCAGGAIELAAGERIPGASPGAPAPQDALRVWPAFETDDRILAVIHALKFARRERLAPWLARALADGLPARALEGDAREIRLVPVPMDRASQRRRGFNQAERIASALGALTGVTVERCAIAKARATAPQSSLGRAERVRNVAGAISIVDGGALAGRDVVLVDDLVTTGATAAACAAAAWSAQAARVRVVCVGFRR